MTMLILKWRAPSCRGWLAGMSTATVMLVFLLAAGASAQELGAARFDGLAERPIVPAPALSDAGVAELSASTATNWALVGLAAGAVLGGLVGYGVWKGANHDYGGDCWFCGVEVVGYVGMGAFMGGGAGAIVAGATAAESSTTDASTVGAPRGGR